MSKVMLVEDDKSLREIYSIRLVAEGYDIVSASDGEEGLALAVKEKPDLIIADVMMPKISGFDMLDILRSTPETANVKVIMMTALSSDDQRQRGEALGANRYLVKSQVGIEDVVNTVHELLEDTPNANAGANLDTVAAIPTRPATAEYPAVPGYEANQEMQAAYNTQAVAQPQAQTMEAPQAPQMPPAVPVAMPAPAPAVPEVAQAPVAPMPAPASPEMVAMPQAQPAPVAAAPVPPMAPVATAAPAPLPVPAPAPVAPMPAPASLEMVAMPQTQPAPVAPVAVTTPQIPTAPVTQDAPVTPVIAEAPIAPAPNIPDTVAPITPEAPSLEAPTTAAVNNLASSKTEGGERVIQPINDPTAQKNQEAITAEMDALLNSEVGTNNDNPFDAPTPPPLNLPETPEAPVATDTSTEGTPDFLAQTDDDFTAAVSEAPVNFSTQDKANDGDIDNSTVQNFEQNEVANAKAEMGLDSDLIEEPSADDASNVTPIQPGYISDLTDELSEDDGNTPSEIENPIAAAMARELADDPVTQQAIERREQGKTEKKEEANNTTILDESDSELPSFLRNGDDSPNLGPNIQSSDTPQGEEALEPVE